MYIVIFLYWCAMSIIKCNKIYRYFIDYNNMEKIKESYYKSNKLVNRKNISVIYELKT